MWVNQQDFPSHKGSENVCYLMWYSKYEALGAV